MNNLEAATQINQVAAKQVTQTDWNLIIAIILAITAVVLIVAAILQWKNNKTYEKLQNENNETTKKNLLHQALLNVQREYSSAEMLFAVQRLWELYRSLEENEEKLVERYKGELSETRRKIKEAVDREKDASEVVRASLHYHRRLVSQFYSHLATLHEQKIIPEPIIFDHWNPWDLDIIDKILFPIDCFLQRENNPEAPEPDKETHRLVLFRKASEKYRKVKEAQQ